MKNNKKIIVLLWVFMAISGVIPAASAEFIAEGVRLTPLTSDGKSIAVAMAYNGEKIIVLKEVSQDQKQLVLINPDGSGAVPITPVGNPVFAEWGWSGKKLSYVFSNADNDQSQAGVYIYDVNEMRSIMVSAPYTLKTLSDGDGPVWSSDDNYIAYNVEPPSQSRQTWIADVKSGKSWRILPDRGSAKEQRWSPFLPSRICLESKDDIVTVSPDGRDLTLITTYGEQSSIGCEEPRWSPDGQWIAYVSNIDMTQAERDLKREDCWIARPDGSEARNLTNATTPVTEKQLNIDEPFWSWDGRWIMFLGDRFDIQGNAIETIYLVDPVNGGYFPIFTSDPRKKGEIDEIKWAKWSYDSTRIAFLTERETVRNWGSDPEHENKRYVLGIYDIIEKKVHEILVFNEELDRKEIIGESDREDIEDISWSPDNRSLVLTIAKIISKEDEVAHPDAYRLDLPENVISPIASEHIGPHMGINGRSAQAPAESAVKEITADTDQSRTTQNIQTDKNGNVTVTIEPVNITVDEVVGSLSSSYSSYLTSNKPRNMLIFKGPVDILDEFKKDLSLIDSPPPHILVDLLAVELSDEANRKLGLDWTYAEGHFALFQPGGNPLQVLPHDSGYPGFPAGALDSLATVAETGQSFYKGVGTLPSEFFVRLNTLVKDGDGTILANPRTVSMSGKQSLIQIRKTLNYFFNEGYDTSGRPIVKKSDISADTEGRITSTLLANGKIHLLVEVSVGSFTFTQNAGLPEQTIRKSTTEVVVEQGQTIIIGGLRQQEMTSSVTKVPILGDLPLVSGLFKNSQQDTRNSVLTIFITPQLLKEEGPAPEWPQIKPEDHKLVPIMENNHKKLRQKENYKTSQPEKE